MDITDNSKLRCQRRLDVDRYHACLNERGYITDTRKENTILKIFQFMNVEGAIFTITEGNNTPT